MNPDNVQGCYGYETQITRVVVHVFTDHARKCGCGDRELR